jgi:hypothetical protein
MVCTFVCVCVSGKDGYCDDGLEVYVLIDVGITNTLFHLRKDYIEDYK